MRKIFFLFILMMAAKFSFSQYNTVKFTPASFTGADSVTFTIDLTGTPLEGQKDVYIWIWTNSGSTDPQYPSKDGIVNTNWAVSPAAAKMTNLGGNVWQYGIVGADIFALAPGQLKYFQFLCKTVDGSKQTDNSPQYNFTPVVYIPTTYRVFPGKVSLSDAVTLYFYQNLSTDLTEQRMTPKSFTVSLQDTSGKAIGQPITLPVKNLGGQLFSASFVPTISWKTISNLSDASQFSYIVNGTSYDTAGTTVNVSGVTNTKEFDQLK